MLAARPARQCRAAPILQPLLNPHTPPPPSRALPSHERCTSCPAAPGGDILAGNFSEYNARFRSVALLGAGARSGTNTARYYSFNQGLTHFLVYTAEAYTYHSGAQFIANQLAFMEADLAAVDRTVTPWVVGLVHKAWW